MGEQMSEKLAAIQSHPIFYGVTLKELNVLFNMCEEKVYQPEEVILYANQERKGLYLIVNGIAEVYVKDEKQRKNEVLEIIEKGELIGFSSLANFIGAAKRIKESSVESMVEVRAVETVYAVHIPFAVITKRWGEPKVHDYLLAQIAVRLRDVYSSLAEQIKLARNHGESDALVMRVQDMMSQKLVTCSPTHSIQEVATLMSQHRVSSILIMEENQLQGIITERDIVERVVVKNRSLQDEAQQIMTRNPHTISRFSYYYDALSALLLKGVKHLPVTDHNVVCGMISLSDLMRKKNESMMKTINSIESADAHSLYQVKKAIYDVFETLLKEKVPMVQSLDIVTKLYDRLMKRAVEIAIEDLSQTEGLKPPVAFNLYAMGSSGRGEQFMLTDQDHFLVFEDNDNEEAAQSYFKMLGEKIVQYLELVGYARCKGLMMSSEETWRGTISEWQNRVREWGVRSTNDHLLLAINFFSYRMVYGTDQLHHKFETELKKTLKRCNMFLYRLTELEKENPVTSLGQPILSLFKLAKKSIDMKKEILFPYHHGLQILSMIHGVLSGTPFERIDALEKKGVLTDSNATDIKEAVNQVLTLYVNLRWRQIKNEEESSSVLHFATLSTREKEELIISMKLLKELQNKIFYHFHMKI